MVLVSAPGVAVVTFTLTVQLPAVTPVPAGTVRPAGSVRLPAACVGAVPPHVVATEAATVARPAGSVSTSAEVSVATLAFGLVSVRVSEVLAPVAMFAAPKAFAMDGATALIVRLAVAAAALLP